MPNSDQIIGLVALPSDILFEIFSYFQLKPRPHAKTIKDTFDTPDNRLHQSTLHSIALTCKRLSSLAQWCLYAHVVPIAAVCPTTTSELQSRAGLDHRAISVASNAWVANSTFVGKFSLTNSLYLCIRDHEQTIHGANVQVTGAQSIGIILGRLAPQLQRLTSLHLDLPPETTPGAISGIGKELIALKSLRHLAVSIRVDAQCTNRQRREIGRALIMKVIVPLSPTIDAVHLDCTGVRFPQLSISPFTTSMRYLGLDDTMGESNDVRDSGLTGMRNLLQAMHAPQLTMTNSPDAHNFLPDPLAIALTEMHINITQFRLMLPFTIADRHRNLKTLIVECPADTEVNILQGRRLAPLKLDRLVIIPRDTSGLSAFISAITSAPQNQPFFGECKVLEVYMDHILHDMREDANGLVSGKPPKTDWISFSYGMHNFEAVLKNTLHVEPEPESLEAVLNEHWLKTFGSI